MNTFYNGLHEIYDGNAEYAGKIATTIEWKNAPNSENSVIQQTIESIVTSICALNIDEYSFADEGSGFIYKNSDKTNNTASKMDLTISCYNKVYSNPRFTYHLEDITNDQNLSTAIWFWLQLHTTYGSNARNMLWIDSVNIKLHD